MGKIRISSICLFAELAQRVVKIKKHYARIITKYSSLMSFETLRQDCHTLTVDAQTGLGLHWLHTEKSGLLPAGLQYSSRAIHLLVILIFYRFSVLFINNR